MKKAAPVVLFLTCQFLTALINLVTAGDPVSTWYKHNYGWALAALPALIAMGAAFANASVEEREAGNDISIGDLFGAVVSSAVVWGLCGALAGTFVSLSWAALVASFAHYDEIQRTTASTFLRAAGPSAIACMIIGVGVGARLGYAVRRNGEIVAIAGGVFGGFSGFAAMRYLQPMSDDKWFAIESAALPVIAAALFGAAWGMFTELFKVGYDRRKVANREILDAAITLLARNNYRIVNISSMAGFIATISAMFDGTWRNRIEEIAERNALSSLETGKPLNVYNSTVELCREMDKTFAQYGPPRTPPWIVVTADDKEAQRFETVAGLLHYANKVDEERLRLEQLNRSRLFLPPE